MPASEWAVAPFEVGDITGAVFETIPEMVARQRETLGDRPAIVDGSTTLTFASSPSASTKPPAASSRWASTKGDRVAIWAPNMWEWIVCALAIHYRRRA